MKKYLWLFIVIFIQVSCLKIEEASNIPKITLNKLDLTYGKDPKLGNELFIMNTTIGFEDGDGNVGTLDTSNRDLFVIPLRRKIGIFADTLDTIKYMIPYIETEKTIRVMRGEIEFEHYLNVYNNSDPELLHLNDTVKFEMYITDRDKNKSNTLITNQYILKTDI